jgi:oligopeptide transport system substrate-binding protein
MATTSAGSTSTSRTLPKCIRKELPVDELGIKAVDDYTLTITTDVPTPYLPGIGTWFGVAPKHAYDQHGENWALDPQKFISSGPYTLTQLSAACSTSGT